MSKRAVEVKLTSEDVHVLHQWSRASTTPQRLALRARIAWAAARGEATTSIARRERVRVATVSKWRRRCAEQGRAGLQDTPRTGRRGPLRGGKSGEHTSELPSPCA